MLVAYMFLVAGIVYSYKLAVTNFEPVIDEKYYEVGLDYQAVLNLQKWATERGYKYTTDIEKLQISSNQKISLEMVGQPLKEEVKAEARFARPATTRGRHSIGFKTVKKTCKSSTCRWLFEGKTGNLAPGHWDVTFATTLGKSGRVIQRKRIYQN